MKILIISLAGIGDTLFAVPLIRGIRRNFPKATIDVLVMWESSASILKNNPDIHTVYKYDMFREGFIKTVSFCAGLREKGYDVSINSCPQGDYRYYVISYLIHAKKRLSHDYGNALGSLIFTKQIGLDYEKHLIDNNIGFLDALGVRKHAREADMQPKIYLSGKNIGFAKRFLARNRLAGRTLIGIHVGSGRTKNLELRRWPTQHYKELIELILKRDRKASVLLFGGSGEVEENTRLARAVGSKNVLVVSSPDIMDSCALVGKLDGFISVDTVFMNIAAAVGVPLQVVIRTPTLNSTVLPKRRNLVVVGKSPPKDIFYLYDGGGIRGGTEEIEQYMQSISPGEVYRAISGRM